MLNKTKGILTKEQICIFDDEMTKDDIIDCFAQTLYTQDRISNVELFIQDVYKREKELSTAMGMGIAIPHALSSVANVASLIVFKLNQPVKWGTNDLVYFVFGIAVPKDNKDNQHLKILSTLARSMMDAQFRESLFTCMSVDEIYNQLENILT